MKFLVDAQLPRRIARRLGELGYDAVHTLELPAANRTPDAEITATAETENRIVVTKDADFVHSFVLYRRPPKLLLISTGTSPTHNWRRCCSPARQLLSMHLHLRPSLNSPGPV